MLDTVVSKVRAFFCGREIVLKAHNFLKTNHNGGKGSQMKRLTAVGVMLFLMVFSLGIADAALIDFNDGTGASAAQEPLTFTLNDFSATFASNFQMSMFNTLPDRIQMNTSPNTGSLNINDGDFFEYTVQADPGYTFDKVYIGFNDMTAEMTMTVTADGNSWDLTNSGSSFTLPGDYSFLTIRNTYSPGQFSSMVMTGNDSPNAFSFSQVPVPGAVWLLASGLVGLVGLRKKYRH
jgi:hypothetical protein